MNYFDFNPNLIDKDTLISKIMNEPYYIWSDDYFKYYDLSSVESIKFHLDTSIKILEDFGIILSDEDNHKIKDIINKFSKYNKDRSEIINAVKERQDNCKHNVIIDMLDAKNKDYQFIERLPDNCIFCAECGMVMSKNGG
jgi:hypothetical protein